MSSDVLLRFTSVSIGTNAVSLIDNIDAQVIRGNRIGLVGVNGSGKSTLLNVIAHSAPASAAAATDDATPDPYWTVTSGELVASESVLLVHQDVLSWTSLFPGVAESEAELLSMTLPEVLELAVAFGVDGALDDEEAWRELYVRAGQRLHWDVAKYESTPLGKLSPGAAKRAFLAVALQRPGGLLLLDEPTNHLDIGSILWMQHALVSSGKAVIMVSHDEAFLDAVADHVWEIDADKHTLTVSGAQYSAYKHAKLKAIESQRRAFDKQQKRHKRLSAVADGLRAKSAAGAAHASKDHDLLQRDFKRDRAGRSGKKAAAIEKRRDAEEHVERVHDHVPLRIQLDPVGAGSDASIMLSGVELGYRDGDGDGDAPVRLPLPAMDLRIDYGERVAICGVNGTGKSSLLRTMVGELEPLAGSVAVGSELRIGNLMQEHESLPRDQVVREFFAEATGMDPFAAGMRLIGFGLSRVQVESRVGELNPGARARVLLALFSARKANALILDECTNHLDQEAVLELVASINEYEGTVVIVSHDRDFIRAVEVTRTLVLSPKGLRRVAFDAWVEELEAIMAGLYE